MAEKNKNVKALVIKIVAWVLAIAAAIVIIVFHDSLFAADNVFDRWIENQSVTNTTLVWLIYAVSHLIRSFEIIVLCAAGYTAAVFILLKCFNKNNRALTVLKLLANFCKYLLALVAVFLILNVWGVDTATLLASAGILALVVGLGAQSLIADIIAGIFIVFDGSYKVGDIIVVDSWRGTVSEVGIRTTKIVDAGGNVKIVNNSSIVDLINQTKELSLAKCTMCISYGESLERVEVVISENLDKIREKIPDIIDGPYYKGVTSLSASSVDLLFVAHCKEDDIYQVQRDLNRQFKLLFDKNGITIPFPQIVVNQPDESNVIVSKRVSSKAEDFVEEQKLASAGMEEEVNNL